LGGGVVVWVGGGVVDVEVRVLWIGGVGVGVFEWVGGGG